MEKSSHDYDQLKQQRQEELKEAISNYQIVQQAKLDLEKQILLLQQQVIELQIKKKSITMSLSKAKAVKDKLQIEVSLMTSKYFAAKSDGL